MALRGRTKLGYIDFKADWQALQARMRADKHMKHVHVPPPPDEAELEVNYDDGQLRNSLTNRGSTLVDADEPPDGWEAYFATSIKHDIQCQQCKQWVPECLPLGPKDESICEACAMKDEQGSLQRARAVGAI